MKLYKIEPETIRALVSSPFFPSDSPNVRPKCPDNLGYEKLLELVKGEDGIIDGGRLRSFAFPVDGDFDVFISHSHNDLEVAWKLAFWFEERCGLKVFLDSFIWESADKLLKDIDDIYCKREDGLYDYRRRNYSTAHIHTMLGISIMEIIKRSKEGILIDSPQSLCINLNDLCHSKTLSPWIYQEIMFMRQFADQASPTRMVGTEFLNESLRVAYPVDLSDFTTLTKDDLISWRKPTRIYISQH